MTAILRAWRRYIRRHPQGRHAASDWNARSYPRKEITR